MGTSTHASLVAFRGRTFPATGQQVCCHVLSNFQICVLACYPLIQAAGTSIATMLIVPNCRVCCGRDMLCMLYVTFVFAPVLLFDALFQVLVITDGQKNISCDSDLQSIQQGQRLLVSAGRQKDQPMVFKVC